MRFLQVIKKNSFLFISFFLLVYILFNLLAGERGLLSYVEKKNIQIELIETKNNLNAKLIDIEKKILLLSDNIDLDYLETVYRSKFFYGKPNEYVYLINANES